MISSTGLNIYEPANDETTELYRQFYLALKPGGKLVTSFLTYPPSYEEKCEWDTTKINTDVALFEKILLADVLNLKGLCFRTSSEMHQQLTSAGFKSVKFINDQARAFPTVVAIK